ncbi:MAG: phytanoyl-CoA dioxygenase family protein [Nitrospira sp.]|nr:phytanoyl-CoA dioxygenase family protein [Nitrospira sp.]
MKDGFVLYKHFLTESLGQQIDKILRKFHASWIAKNHDFYKKGILNSSSITNGEFLTVSERFELLKFIGSSEIVNKAKEFLGSDIRFLNTQIFFNPCDINQNNYWHRDIQYTGISETEQRLAIEKKESAVIHLRLAFADELGIDFVPESHSRWDNQEELDVRLQRNGKESHDSIPGSKSVSLEKGDLLVFDANIIHRGLYGLDRFSFDILFCKPLPEILKFAQKETYPTSEELASIECPEIFN